MISIISLALFLDSRGEYSMLALLKYQEEFFVMPIFFQILVVCDLFAASS